MFAVEVPARTKMVRYKHRPVSFVESGWGAYYAPFPIELINIVTFDTLRCTISQNMLTIVLCFGLCSGVSARHGFK